MHYITILVLIYLIGMVIAWFTAGRSAAFDVEEMKHETAIFQTKVRAAGQLTPPQGPITIAYQNIFWQGLVWPAFLGAGSVVKHKE